MLTKEQAEQIFKNLAYKEKTYKDLENELGMHKTTICKKMKTYKKEFGMKDKETYCARTYLRFKYANEIKERYNNGESSKSIALSYGFSDESIITSLLKDINVEVRSKGYVSRTNQKLFSAITNEIEAYTLGLILSDGNIGYDYSISISLIASDGYLLDAINEKLYNSTGNTLRIDFLDRASMYRLRICGKEIYQNLEKYGAIPNKTYTLTKLPILDDNLMPHLIRGLYDGDGVCAKNGDWLRVGYCSYNIAFTKEFQLYLCEKLSLNENKLFNTGSCWHCSWGSRNNLEKIYKYLYNNATIFLCRKKDKLHNYLYGNTEVND